MKDYSSFTEEELVAAYHQGDFDAMEFICNQYKGYILKYSKGFFIKGSETQDVIQEGMVGLFKAIQDYDPKQNTSFSSFAKLCIKRQIIKAMEAADRLKNQPLNSYVSLYQEEEEINTVDVRDSLLTDENYNPENMMIDTEKTVATLENIVGILSKLELQVFFYMMQGYDYKTIADKMCLDDKKIDNAIQRIRQKAKRFIV